MKPIVFADTEVYRTWSCINFKHPNGQYYQYVHKDLAKLDRRDVEYFIQQCVLVGFNFINYDVIMFLLMLQGASNYEMFVTSGRIIVDKERPWEIMREKQLNRYELDVIDIMPLLVGQASLKLYGARIHFKKLQELPIDPQKAPTEYEQSILLKYCDNDCDVTGALFDVITDEVDLRIDISKQYGMDLRSKSGPGIAAAVIGHEYKRMTGKKPFTPTIGVHIPEVIRYKKPDWISFRTPHLQELLSDIESDEFEINAATGHLILDANSKGLRDRIVNLEDRSVKLGIGGLHSIDGPGYYQANDQRCIIDIDAVSHYPLMILNSGWFPGHLGREYLEVYRTLVNRRIEAKRSGDKSTANILKLVINSSFGLLSQQNSILYDPQMFLAVTVSGQLSLLMLAERLEAQGYFVISANTDGIVISPLRVDIEKVRIIVEEFEKDTGLKMEETWYSQYVRRDVNNYFTVLEDLEDPEKNDIKSKGIFQSSYCDVEHNPTGNIIVDAVVAFFVSGIDIELTILASRDIRDFINVRTVKGGGLKDGNHLGKIVRWYYSTSTNTPITYESSGNTVPKSQGGMPVMDLPEQFPEDVDYEAYIKEATELLDTLQVLARSGHNKIVFGYTSMGLSIVPWPHKGLTISKVGSDFSTVSKIGIQTGYRANTIAIRRRESMTLTMGDWSFYQFNDKRYPASLKTVSKKLGFEIKYGGAIELNKTVQGKMIPLPDILKNSIFNNLGLPQRRKVVDNIEYLL